MLAVELLDVQGVCHFLESLRWVGEWVCGFVGFLVSSWVRLVGWSVG